MSQKPEDTPNRKQLCDFLSLHGGIDEVFVLLACEFSSFVIPLLTFGDSIKVSFSRVKYEVLSKNSGNLNSAPEPVVECPSAARCG